MGAPITVLLLSLVIICHCNPVRPRQILPPPTKLPQAFLLLFNPDAPFDDKPTRNTRPFSVGVYSSISEKWNKNTKPNLTAASVSILNTETQAPLPTSPSAPAFSSAKTITSSTTKEKPEVPPTVFALLSSKTMAQLTTKTLRMTATNPGREQASKSYRKISWPSKQGPRAPRQGRRKPTRQQSSALVAAPAAPHGPHEVRTSTTTLPSSTSRAHASTGV
jgi:hypothetical protein